ncbi:ECF transporter S component [Clostridium fallax]|uniref:Uncharacterized membrane protein n=1 Tax=Clostridium fallax TaxID=1533 RepID=A0A1M4Y9V3_9CLOT|nr:ECF transporter S component [Clostridium fallax]SHF02413.1 Uncharacterized membrane protein [Clostridium fallax]SQB06037.1 membrane protein [Clostridium fallax]
MERGIKTHSRLNVKKLVIAGMLSAISIFLGITRLGFIAIPPVSATIMHVPVIIGAILEGPMVGALVGGCFGLFSMYQAVTAPTPTSFIFLNPIIALLPRILIGIGAYYVFIFTKKIFKNKFKGLSIGISAIIATLINTIGVLGLTYIIYLDSFASAINVSKQTVGTVLLTIGATNGIPEAILSALITIPVVIGVSKARR